MAQMKGQEKAEKAEEKQKGNINDNVLPLFSLGFIKKHQQEEKSKKKLESKDAKLKEAEINGIFVPFYLDYHGKSSEMQAREILKEVRILKELGYEKVGITYSANEGQTKKIRKCYDAKDTGDTKAWETGTAGANQATVMAAVERLLKTNEFKALQGVFEICPITTLPNDLIRESRHLEIVQTDLARIKERYLQQNGCVLGWQNSDSIAKNRYAVGGGVVPIHSAADDKRRGGLPAAVDDLIQETLSRYAAAYPMPVIEQQLKAERKS